MPDLFIIDEDIRTLTFDAISTMIHQLGKDCKLIFDPITTQCPNCIFDSVNNTSSGVYNGTGPVSFTRPPCPVCRGVGTIVEDAVEQTVRFLIDWQPKPWLYLPAGTVVPEGLVQTKGFIEVLPLVIQSNEIIIDPAHALYQNNRFMKWGEPVPTGNIKQNSFFIAFWQRKV